MNCEFLKIFDRGLISRPKTNFKFQDKEKKTVSKKTSCLHFMDPFVDEKRILRVEGRIKRASLS